MYRTGNYLRHINELIPVKIFCPVRRADDKSDPRDAGRNLLRGHHFPVLFRKRETAALSAFFPHPDIPAAVVVISSVVMQLDRNTLCRMYRYCIQHHAHKRYGKQHHCHHKRTDPSSHFHPPSACYTLLLYISYLYVINIFTKLYEIICIIACQK